MTHDYWAEGLADWARTVSILAQGEHNVEVAVSALGGGLHLFTTNPVVAIAGLLIYLVLFGVPLLLVALGVRWWRRQGT
jgi:hypothetical protein